MLEPFYSASSLSFLPKMPAFIIRARSSSSNSKRNHVKSDNYMAKMAIITDYLRVLPDTQ